MAEAAARNRLGVAQISAQNPHLVAAREVASAYAIQVRFRDIALSGTRSNAPKFGSKALAVFHICGLMKEECDLAIDNAYLSRTMVQ